MPRASSRLSLLTFPQFWDGQSLAVRFLCLPRPAPDVALGPSLPDFAHANLVFRARLISGLDAMPAAANAIDEGPLLLEHPPLNKATLFEELTEQFDILPPAPVAGPPAERQFLKASTESYDRLAGTARRSRYMRERDDYECALHEAATNQQAEENPVVLSTSLTWGRVIAHALRQPVLAEALGLMGQASVAPPAGFFEHGGWLFVDLHDTSDGAATVGLVARYAARIPPLTGTPRAIFAAVLFPVDGGGVGDDVFREAEVYDDGLAKQVHGAQLDVSAADRLVPERGDSIQLAWDDEQIAIWLNRQVERLPNQELKVDAPSGVAGYRVDVRPTGAQAWSSLLRVESRGALALGPHALRPYDGEHVIEVVPVQHATEAGKTFWLPSYFAAWRGRSLALSNPDLVALHAHVAGDIPAGAPAQLLDREQVFDAVADDEVMLRYGSRYDFRVRLADLTRGGPGWKTPDPEVPGDSIVSIDFTRHHKPGPLNRLVRPPHDDPETIVLEKPRLGFPEALFAGATLADIKADLDAIRQSRTSPDQTTWIVREAGAFDPDVVSVEIVASVKTLSNDLDAYGVLYTTERDMPQGVSELTLSLQFENRATLDGFDVDQPSNGPLRLPTAREIRLTLTPIGRDTPGHFAGAEARRGTSIDVDVRREAATEGALLSDVLSPLTPLQAFFFQPPGAADAPPIARLGVELGLDCHDMTLSGKAGRRTVIGCSSGLRHTLSPERSGITFASSADLLKRWISVVRMTIDRDWTWDGLAETGIAVTRVLRRPAPAGDTTASIGTVRVPHSLASKARAGSAVNLRAAARQSTEIIFFDAFDPKPEDPDQFPAELTVDYVLEPSFVIAPPPMPEERSIELPVTTAPSQVPRILSAGIALSRYEHANDYSSSEPRERMLWFELAEAPRDSKDEYFVRILGYAPDPLLMQLQNTPPAETVEPPLPIDPESMRKITPGQPHDDSGLNAMTGIAASERAAHCYLVPLPEGLTEASPELFGFFVYEIRVGHASRWSTAQGRFGPPLRVAGVQHPAPTLTCHAARNEENVLVRAPFAAAVRNGQNLRPRNPQSELWALLYARVRQADAAAWRNVLLAQAQLGSERRHDRNSDDMVGEGRIPFTIIHDALQRLGLPPNTPLTVMTAEMFGRPRQQEPLGAGLGHARILRTSPLIAVPDAC